MDPKRELADAQQQIEGLREELRRADDAYYLVERPKMSDEAYDARLRELGALEARFPEHASPESPTRRVGGRPSAQFSPVRHAAPMLSLDNAFTAEEVRLWHARIEREAGRSPALFCELKIDGLAVALTYQGGRLLRGATRGDGEVGEDVTGNLRTLAEIPDRLAVGEPPARLEVRGEVFMPFAGFEALNRELTSQGQPAFANPRNAAAGSLRQKDARVTARRLLRIWIHGVGFAEGVRFERHSEALAWLARAGLPVHPASTLVPTLAQALELCALWESGRRSLDHAVDGAVLKVDELALRQELGATAKAPRWAVAYKFAPEERATLLRRIEVHTGRSGKVTPFAVLEPVDVGGATVGLASLHNEDEVRRKDLREGDTVVVRRAGEVIPEVVAPVLDARPAGSEPWRFPRTCPSCGAALVRAPGEADWRCPNRAACPSQGVEWLLHFASRGAMDVDRLGYRTALALLERGLVADPGDLYALTAREVSALPGHGARSTELLLEAIARSRDRALWRLLVALNLRHVGPSVARRLARAFPSLDALAAASLAQLQAVPGVGSEIAQSVFAALRAPATVALVGKLRRAGVRLEERPSELELAGPLRGQTIVLTGTLGRLSREEAVRAAEQAGAHVASSVSRRTSFVVAGESPGTKLARARALGVPVVQEQEFLERVQGRR